MHLGAGVQAAIGNLGVTGKECQSWVIKFKQKIWPWKFGFESIKDVPGNEWNIFSASPQVCRLGSRIWALLRVF